MPARAHRVFRRPLALVLALASLFAPAQTAATSQPQYTLQTRVPITILDVVVTDAKGRPVHGLKQSDFTILEDKDEMHPNSFEEHRSDETPPVAPMLASQPLPANTFTNLTPAPPNSGPINILLLDSLNTPTGVQGIVQKEMLAYIKKMRPGTRVAIFSFNYRLVLLQGFTSDPELLNSAINSKKDIAQPSPLEDRGQDIAGPDDPGCVEQEHMAARGQYTLAATRQLARYLSGLPGRKNLIWFGGSFPIQADCDDQYAQVHYDYTKDLEFASDQLARAHVVLYPVDGRALDSLAGGAGNVRKQVLEHLTMEATAEDTGGKATYTSNDLAGAVSDAIDLGSNFYTVTYTPTNQTLDTRFRTITVKVDQPGLHLTYRPGYYAVDPDVDTRGKQIPKVTPMQSAMMRGSLEPTQIPFRVTVAQSPSPETVLPVSNHPDAKQMHPPYRHYSIAFLIDIANIGFKPSPDGNYRGDFEYGVMVYNADGDAILNSASKTVSPILPPAVFQSMLRGGANAHLDIDLPATGDYFLRIGVHDLASDRVGAIEIPTRSLTPDRPPALASQK